MLKKSVVRIQRTTSQSILYVVSILMWVVTAILLIFGLFIIFKQESLPEGIAVAASSALLGLTAAWGTSASNNYQKISRYRALCYIVSLVLLLVLAYGWSNGHIFLFNPTMMLMITIYVLICSSLADRVERDLKEGVKGPLIVRNTHQQSLHFIASTLVLFGVVMLFLSVISKLYLDSNAALAVTFASPNSWLLQSIFHLSAKDIIVIDIALLGLRDALVGLFGIVGANHPRKSLPCLIFSLLALAFELAKQISDGIHLDFLGANGSSSLMALTFFATTSYLSYKLLVQTKKHPNELVFIEKN